MKYFITILLLFIAIPAGAKSTFTGGTFTAGTLHHSIAYVRDYGYSGTDDTAAIQAAIDTSASKVVISDKGTWVTGPITLASNQEIIFESGAQIDAKSDEYGDSGDCMFTGSGISNLTISGAGTIDMDEITDSSPVTKHIFKFIGCSDIEIKEISIDNSAADGVYITKDAPNPTVANITIDSVDIDGSYRQGITVISADTLVVKDSTIQNTIGVSPQSAIDLEPNDATGYLKNIEIYNNEFDSNTGAGVLVSLHKIRQVSDDVSISVHDNTSNYDVFGFRVIHNGSEGPSGTVTFEDNVITQPRANGFRVNTHNEDFLVNFSGTIRDRVDTYGAADIEIFVEQSVGSEYEGTHVNLDGTYIYSDIDEPTIICDPHTASYETTIGTIYASNANGVTSTGPIGDLVIIDLATGEEVVP